MEDQKDRKKDCPCPNKGCPRHGDCKKCQEYHAKNGSSTYCGK